MSTTVSQQARARVTARYFGRGARPKPATVMPSPAAAPQISRDEAERGLAYLTEMTAGLRGGAILDGSGGVLAASGELEAWEQAARELLEAADAAGSEPAEHVHVATADGEVFALRQGDLLAVAVTDRFVLASLMVFDMRAVLRDLERSAGGRGET